NGKISQRIGKSGTIALSFYNSHDNFIYSDEFGFSWDLNNLSLKWDQVINPELISQLSISYSQSANTSFQPSGIDGFILGNGMNNYKLKEDLLITSWPGNTINAGFEINSYVPDDETLQPFDDESTIISYEGIKDKGIESAIYFNDAIELSSRLSLSIGLRYSLYSQRGPAKVVMYQEGIPNNTENIIDSLVFGDGEKVVSYQGFDPRFSMVYTLNSSSSLKMSFNRINQYIHLISNTTAALPIDFWQVSNTYFKPLKANNYSLGYFKNFKLNQWETSLEGYYRDMENIVEYKDFPELFLNDHLETELLSGVGKSYGLEFYVKKKTGKVTGWLSYTFARTYIKIADETGNEEINRGEWFPSKYDQPHNLSIVGNINLNKTNQLSFNFTYPTGRPLTGPDSNYGLRDAIIPNYSDRNKFRLPDYHRLDVSYTIQRGLLRTHKYKDSFTFSIYNVYGRKNAYSIFFKGDKANAFGAYKLSILGSMLPSVTYNFKF
ncbi:MAG: TonB-dependent receptor, partial [Cyclobacteriaceae bacterium]|nr:TonB-dependent receptor [Cyclobacteriaceae bacterium]